MKYLYTSILVLIFNLHAGTLVFALDTSTYTPLAPLPDLVDKSADIQLKKVVGFQSYVQNMYNLLVALGAVAAVVMITWGGFEYMTSDAVQGKSDGLKKVQNAIYGLLLILSSYLILRTIDPRFVQIPSSLVDPLDLKAEKNALSDWLNRLSSEVHAFDADQAAARQKIAEAKTKITELAKNITDSNKKIATLSGIDVDSVNLDSLDFNTMCKEPVSDEIRAECANRSGLQNEIVKTQSETTLFTRQKTIDTLVAQCGTTAGQYDPECYTREANKIRDNYVTKNWGADMQPEDVVLLSNYARSAQAKLAMNGNLDNLTAAISQYKMDGKSWIGKANQLTSELIVNTVTLGTYSLNKDNDMLNFKSSLLREVDDTLAKAKNAMTDQKSIAELTTYAQSIKDKLSAQKI